MGTSQKGHCPQPMHELTDHRGMRCPGKMLGLGSDPAWADSGSYHFLHIWFLKKPLFSYLVFSYLSLSFPRCNADNLDPQALEEYKEVLVKYPVR